MEAYEKVGVTLFAMYLIVVGAWWYGYLTHYKPHQVIIPMREIARDGFYGPQPL